MSIRITNTVSVPAASLSTGGTPSLTPNLLQTTDFEDFPYMDLARVSRGWSGDVDAQGNLTNLTGTGIARTFFISAIGDDRSTWGTYLNGGYTLRWDGGASATVAGKLNSVVNSQSTGTASLTLTFSGNMDIQFNNIDASDPPTNIRIIRDSDVAAYDAGAKFRPEFLNLLRDNCYSIRFMDWMRTNFSPVVDWADYPTESWQNWPRAPFSIMIDLCNELQVHPWICVPHQATDAFVTSMATQLDNDLDPGLFVDIEYSNEFWNFGFTQWNYVEAQALADWGITGLEQAMSWGGKRFVEVMDLVEAVSPTRFRGVIASQAADASKQLDVLDAPAWKANDPVNYVAPHTRATYFSVTDYFLDPVDLAPVMDVFDANWDAQNLVPIRNELREAAIASQAKVRGYIDGGLARCSEVDHVDGLTRNLRFRTYEGGSNHGTPDGGRTMKFFLPIAWASGIDVFSGEWRINSFGRVYVSTGAGTTGATEPTHTDGSTVSDGAVSWQDFTGDVTANTASRDFRLRLDSASGRPMDSYGFPNVAYSATTYSAGDFVRNTSNRVYRVKTGGTASAEPTHTSGDVTTGGVEYTYLGELHDPSSVLWSATTYTAGDFVYTKDVNDFLRFYEVTTGGTATVEPTHNGGTETVGGVEYRAVSPSQLGLNLVAYSATTYNAGDYVENSNGSIYQVTAGGTATVEPTHTSGTQIVGGVEYTFKPQFLNEIRAEFWEWCNTYMYDGEMANHIIELFRYQKEQGCESPSFWNLNARLSRFGFWGKFQGFNDTGPNRAHPIGDMLMAWSRANPKWWTD